MGMQYTIGKGMVRIRPKPHRACWRSEALAHDYRLYVLPDDHGQADRAGVELHRHATNLLPVKQHAHVHAAFITIAVVERRSIRARASVLKRTSFAATVKSFR